MPTSVQFANTILRRLRPEIIARLHLQSIDLPAGYLLEQPERDTTAVYFLERGLASVTTLFQNGHKVDVGLYGSEGVIGMPALMGGRQSVHEVVMRIAGQAYRSPLTLAEAEYLKHGQFHDLCLRYVQMQFVHAWQTSACNATHEAPERLASWLLLCCERIRCDSIPLTHDFFAQILGIRRSSISLAAEDLQAHGFISYTRGQMEVLDRPGLKTRACECFQLMELQLRNFNEDDRFERPAILRPSFTLSIASSD